MTKRIFLLCGIPGSGKSYWSEEQAEALGDDARVISRDKIRFSLLQEGDEYFKRENAVFAQFVKNINDCIREGIPYIFIDATHISKASRAKILSRLKISGPISLSVEIFNTSLKTCLERNSNRTGLARVPVGVIKSMAKEFTEPTDEEYKEFEKYGFTKIEIFHHIEEVW